MQNWKSCTITEYIAKLIKWINDEKHSWLWYVFGGFAKLLSKSFFSTIKSKITNCVKDVELHQSLQLCIIIRLKTNVQYGYKIVSHYYFVFYSLYIRGLSAFFSFFGSFAIPCLISLNYFLEFCSGTFNS